MAVLLGLIEIVVYKLFSRNLTWGWCDYKGKDGPQRDKAQQGKAYQVANRPRNYFKPFGHMQFGFRLGLKCAKCPAVKCRAGNTNIEMLRQ